MENGYDDKLTEKFSGMAIDLHSPQLQDDQPHDQFNPSSNNNDSLIQVMKAVEAAEATIKQQVEENNRLRSELQLKIQELERYKQDESMGHRRRSTALWNEHGHGSHEPRQSVPSTAISNPESHLDNNKINGTPRVPQNDRPPLDNTGHSQLSSPSTRSISPSRLLVGEDYDSQYNLSGQGLMAMSEINNSNSLWKQDLAAKIREHEEEIMRLRKHLADYSIREAQIRNEKYVLEKRIAYMRLAFDQQQQDLVDAASKALSYRQDIIEENIRLTYALQDAQQERSTFISSLLPLLAEYSLHLHVTDAQSIVNNVKVLFRHLQEKLLLTESKLKESQYQLTPWHLDTNHANSAPQSPSPFHLNKNGLQLVPQPIYSHSKAQVNADGKTGSDWDILGHHHSGLGGGLAGNMDADELGRFSPLASRNPPTQDMPTHAVIKQTARYGEDMTNKQVTFRDPVSNTEADDPDGYAHQSEREIPANWSSGNSPYTNTVDDPTSSYSPYLPPVLEEPSSSFSEAADDDLLPAIDGLQISGEAIPGRELQACGYSINGTTSCNFEWIRHMEDGSVNYIEGAKQPNYLVTADDVDTYLAIEVQPLDDRKRKGEPVKVFANDNKKITCDPEMLSHIEKTLSIGHASYKISHSTGFLDIWEPATLVIKREGYSIKCSGQSGVIITEKFSPSTSVVIPYGHVSEFMIIGNNGAEHLLRAEDSPTDVSGCRDTIVLTLRLFNLRAVEKKRGKKKGLFFNK